MDGMQEALHNLILDLMLLANGGTGNLGVPSNQNRTGGGGSPEKSGAWTAKNEWSDAEIEKYSEYYKKRCKEAVENGEKYDCMDFQMRVLFEYAMENSLPLILKTMSGKSISYKDYSSPEAFWKALSSELSALNLDLLANTEMVSYQQRMSGDMKLLEFGSSMHVVGYFMDYYKGVYKPLSYGNITNDGKTAPVRFHVNEWTRSYPNLVGYENGERIYGSNNYVLRWNFQQFNKRK